MTYPQKTGGVQDDFSAGVDSPADVRIQQLIGLLKDGGPRSRREMEAALGVKRGVFQNRYLNPARARGLVVATEKGSSPHQRYKLAVAPCDRLDASAWQALPTLPSFPSKIEETGLGVASKATFLTAQTFVVAPAPAESILLQRFRRWYRGEKISIFRNRVERRLRSMFASNEWKELGIANRVGTNVFACCDGRMFCPNVWGPQGVFASFAVLSTS